MRKHNHRKMRAKDSTFVPTILRGCSFVALRAGICSAMLRSWPRRNACMNERGSDSAARRHTAPSGFSERRWRVRGSVPARGIAAANSRRNSIRPGTCPRVEMPTRAYAFLVAWGRAKAAYFARQKSPVGFGQAIDCKHKFGAKKILRRDACAGSRFRGPTGASCVPADCPQRFGLALPGAGAVVNYSQWSRNLGR